MPMYRRRDGGNAGPNAFDAAWFNVHNLLPLRGSLTGGRRIYFHLVRSKPNNPPFVYA